MRQNYEHYDDCESCIRIFYFPRCQGIDDRKEETVPSSSSYPPTIAPTPAAICSASATFNHVTPVQFRQPTHMLAAIALSELAATSMKRYIFIRLLLKR